MAEGVTVAAGETLTVESGDTFWSDPVNCDGTISVDGTFNVEPAENASASGVGSGVGTATGSAERSVAASGIGASGRLPSLDVGGAETQTILGERTYATANVDGVLNAQGTVNVDTQNDTEATASVEYDATASGIAAGVGTATGSAEYSATAAGVGAGVGTATASVAVPATRTTQLDLVWNRADVSLVWNRTDLALDL